MSTTIRDEEQGQDKTHTYTVRTDALLYDDFEAADLDAAIREAFEGEIPGIVDETTLQAKFERYVADGGWCWIEQDGERVVEIGEVP